MNEQNSTAIDADAIDWDAEPDMRTRVADLVPLSLLDGRDPRQDVFEVADQILAVVPPPLPSREQIIRVIDEAVVYDSTLDAEVISPEKAADAILALLNR